MSQHHLCLSTDRSLYASAKSTQLHMNDNNYGPSVAIDDQNHPLSGRETDGATGKPGSFISGGGSGVPKFQRGWIEISLTEPTELMGLQVAASCFYLSNFPNGFLGKFKIRAGLTTISKSQNDASDNELNEYPVVGIYDGENLMDCKIAYLTFEYTVKAKYVLLQADWSSQGLFSLSEVRFLRGTNKKENRFVLE